MNYIEDVKVKFVDCFDAVAEGLLSILAKGGVDIAKYNYEKCENPSDQIMKNNMKIHLITNIIIKFIYGFVKLI